jgi:hypothetical protein
LTPETRVSESARKAQTAFWSTAHNPEVAGSSPVPATKKPPFLPENGGFSFEKVADFFL